MSKRALHLAVSLLLAAVLLALFLWNVDLAEVGVAMARVELDLLGLCLVLIMASYWLRALRWQIILRPLGGVRHSSVVLATATGYAAMGLLPARMGDVVRPLLLARRENRPASGALASVVVERIFDLWTVLAFFFLFTLDPPEMAFAGPEATAALDALTLTGYGIGAGLVVLTLILLGLARFQERFVVLAAAPVGRVKERWRRPVERFLMSFVDGFRTLERPRDLLLALVLSVLIWFLIYWQVKVTLLAFAITVPLRATYLLVVISIVGLAIPTPAGVGGFHKAVQIGLTLFFAVDLNLATSVAIIHHAMSFIPITVVGLLCLPAFGVSLREIDSLAETADRRPL